MTTNKSMLHELKEIASISNCLKESEKKIVSELFKYIAINERYRTRVHIFFDKYVDNSNILDDHITNSHN